MNLVKQTIRTGGIRLKQLISICAVIIVAYLMQLFAPWDLMQWALYPRNTDQIVGILVSPFLHGGVFHLLNNLLGLLVFGALCMLRSPQFFWINSLIIILLSGFLVWSFGRDAFHIGASGWVYGLWSLQMAYAWFERDWKNILIAIFVVFFYSGLTFGMLPIYPHVSFEAHIFGAVAGIVSAFVFSKFVKSSVHKKNKIIQQEF